jgi:hypothetical protein
MPRFSERDETACGVSQTQILEAIRQQVGRLVELVQKLVEEREDQTQLPVEQPHRLLPAVESVPDLTEVWAEAIIALDV